MKCKKTTFNLKCLKLRYKIKLEILKNKYSKTKKKDKILYPAIKKISSIVWRSIEVIGLLASVIAIILFIQDGNMSIF